MPVTAARYKVRRDRILFVDVEMTCWEGLPPAGEVSEIIEFGLAEVDVAHLSLTRSGSILVRPVRSRLSDYCINLTGIDQDALRSRGRPLSEACNVLRKVWGTANKAWFSWGSDRQAVDEDCAMAGILSPFSSSFHDIGFHFGLMIGAGEAVGLTRAMLMLGLERNGRVHSGENDAVAAAQAWIALARRVRTNLMANAPPKP